MDHEAFVQNLAMWIASHPGNFISQEDAISPELAGLQLFDDPIVGFAAADDALFTREFKQEGVIHPDYWAPRQWLPGAKTVISFFLPFSQTVIESNRCQVDTPYEPELPQKCSAPWLHARVEGQDFLNQVTDHIQAFLAEGGFESVCPTTSGKLRMLTPYISTWSERHAAYAAGLGTFGLSKGLITARGMAGRFGSVITNAPFAPSVRSYQSPFEYCTMCGACMTKCPAGAIDKSKGCALGKDQLLCGPYVNSSFLPPQGPNQRVRYGCGKCQCGVPCESRIPVKNNGKSGGFPANTKENEVLL